MKKILSLLSVIGLLIGCGQRDQGTLEDTGATGADRYGTNNVVTNDINKGTAPTTPPSP